MMGTSLIVIVGSVVMGVVGQLVLKIGADSVGEIRLLSPGAIESLVGVASNPYVQLGIPLFIMGSMLWMVVLSRFDLSHAYPFLGLNYLLVTLMAWLVLGEQVKPTRWIAVGLVILGIALVGQSAVHQRKEDALSSNKESAD